MAEPGKPHFQDFFLYIFVIVATILVIYYFLSKGSGQKSNSADNSLLTVPTGNTAMNQNSKRYSAAPKMEIDPKKKYQAVISTSKGPITVELFADETPVTVNNFVFLARQGFYDGTVFHRIIKGFMIQGGDPNGDGSGGPGYSFADEKITRDYKRGIIAMANSGPDTNGSQFFIMHQDYNLPKHYVIFGQVVSGMDTVDKIADVPVTDNGFGEKSKPGETVAISKITVTD